MAFPIVPKYNAVATSQAAPLAGDLQLAELAVNTQTNKAYLKGNGGVFELGSDKVSTSQLTTAATANGVPQLTGAGLISTSQIQALTTSQIADLTQTAVAYKIPQLGSDGKIPAALLPPASVGALTYKGAWTVNTSPVIASGGVVGGGTADKGDYYVAANTATLGTAIDGKTQILAGDLIAFNGSTWDLIHGATSEVISVNSQTPVNGNVTLTAANVGAVSTSQLTTLAVANGVPQLNGAGQITTAQLQITTTAQLGVMKVGDNLSVDAAGRVSAIQGTYTLPVATDTVLGGIKSSASINIATTGIATVASAGTY
jgi:hypothetical protein